jgi:hypothetical protein
VDLVEVLRAAMDFNILNVAREAKPHPGSTSKTDINDHVKELMEIHLIARSKPASGNAREFALS